MGTTKKRQHQGMMLASDLFIVPSWPHSLGPEVGSIEHVERPALQGPSLLGARMLLELLVLLLVARSY